MHLILLYLQSCNFISELSSSTCSWICSTHCTDKKCSPKYSQCFHWKKAYEKNDWTYRYIYKRPGLNAWSALIDAALPLFHLPTLAIHAEKLSGWNDLHLLTRVKNNELCILPASTPSIHELCQLPTRKYADLIFFCIYLFIIFNLTSLKQVVELELCLLDFFRSKLKIA